MNLTEAESLVAYANQLDPRIQVNPAANDMWQASLQRIDYAVAQWIVRDYYANALTEGQPPPISPQVIRRLSAHAREEQQARESAQQALPPGKQQTYTTLQSGLFKSLEFKALFNEARKRRADRLASRGINPTPHHLSPQDQAEWATITGHTPTH